MLPDEREESLSFPLFLRPRLFLLTSRAVVYSCKPPETTFFPPPLLSPFCSHLLLYLLCRSFQFSLLSASSDSKRERLFPRAALCVYLATFPTAPRRRAVEGRGGAERRQNSGGRLTRLIRSRTQNSRRCRPRRQAPVQEEAIAIVGSGENRFIR